MAEHRENLVKKVIDSNESVYEDHLIATVDGYDFAMQKDPDNDGDWYIQVNPEGEGFLYDGWWNDSGDKSLEEAVREAIQGSGVLGGDK